MVCVQVSAKQKFLIMGFVCYPHRIDPPPSLVRDQTFACFLLNLSLESTYKFIWVLLSEQIIFRPLQSLSSFKDKQQTDEQQQMTKQQYRAQRLKPTRLISHLVLNFLTHRNRTFKKLFIDRFLHK